MGDLSVRIVINGTDHSFQRELGCKCGRCKSPYFRGNTSASLVVVNSAKSKDEIVGHALVDAGSGVVNNLYDNLAAYEGDPRVDVILLTHWHPDHTLGLNQLCEGLRRSRILADPAADPVEGPISLWCRPVTLDHLKASHRFEAHRFLKPINQTPDSNPPGCLLDPLDSAALGIEELKIQPVTLSHKTASDFSTAGFLITRPGGTRRAALLWDMDRFNDDWVLSSAPSKAREALKGLDLLFMDCNTWKAEESRGRNTGHISFERLQRYVNALRPRETILVHLSGHEDGRGELGWGWSNAEWEFHARQHWDPSLGIVTVLNPGQMRAL